MFFSLTVPVRENDNSQFKRKNKLTSNSILQLHQGSCQFLSNLLLQLYSVQKLPVEQNLSVPVPQSSSPCQHKSVMNGWMLRQSGMKHLIEVHLKEQTTVLKTCHQQVVHMTCS